MSEQRKPCLEMSTGLCHTHRQPLIYCIRDVEAAFEKAKAERDGILTVLHNQYTGFDWSATVKKTKAILVQYGMLRSSGAGKATADGMPACETACKAPGTATVAPKAPEDSQDSTWCGKRSPHAPHHWNANVPCHIDCNETGRNCPGVAEAPTPVLISGYADFAVADNKGDADGS
jgi:hypothetical protein